MRSLKKYLKKITRIIWIIQDFIVSVSAVNIYFDEILPGLSLGSQEAVKDRTQHWTHIITLRENGVKVWVHRPTKHYRIKINDDDTENIQSEFNGACKWIHTAIKHSCSRILIHCHAGVSRSPTIICAYLMKYYKVSVKDALEFINRRRTVLPNDGFLKQLEQYSKFHI